MNKTQAALGLGFARPCDAQVLQFASRFQPIVLCVNFNINQRKKTLQIVNI